MSHGSLIRTIIGILGGIAVFFGLMGALAFLSTRLSILLPESGNGVDLTNWLVVEILVGGAAGALAGLVSRRLGRGPSAPVSIALLILCLGVVEASLLQTQMEAGRAAAPLLLIWIAPAIGPLGILVGGLLLRRNNPPQLG